MTDTALVFNEIKSSIDILGTKGFVETLRNAKTAMFKNQSTAFIVEAVSNAICIPVTELKTANIRSDKKKVAIAFCAHFLYTEFEYSYQEISQMLPFDLDKVSIIRYHKIIKEAKLEKPHSDLDKLISTNYYVLTDLIIKYKNTQNNGREKQ